MLPPIKKRSPFGVEIDLWNDGILNAISNFIAINSDPGEFKSNKCKKLSSFWKKCKYFFLQSYLNVFNPIILIGFNLFRFDGVY